MFFKKWFKPFHLTGILENENYKTVETVWGLLLINCPWLKAWAIVKTVGNR